MSLVTDLVGKWWLISSIGCYLILWVLDLFPCVGGLDSGEWAFNGFPVSVQIKAFFFPGGNIISIKPSSIILFYRSHLILILKGSIMFQMCVYGCVHFSPPIVVQLHWIGPWTHCLGLKSILQVYRLTLDKVINLFVFQFTLHKLYDGRIYFTNVVRFKWININESALLGVAHWVEC